MRTAAIAVLAGAACQPGVHRPAPAMRSFFVAPGGSDRAAGTAEAPFATLERARDAIRELRREVGYPAGGVEVVIRGGRYERATTFELTAEDSGVPGAPVIYRAARGETARITGGRPLAFHPIDDDRISPVARGHVVAADVGTVAPDRDELVFDGVVMTPARWPDTGFATLAGADGPRLRYDGERPARWVGEPDAWLHGYWAWDWADERERISAIDPAQRTIELAPPYHQYGYRAGARFYAYNVLAELDRPGEWYLDRARGQILFWPPHEGGEALLPVTEDLVTLRGASDVVLRDLTLEVARGTAITIDAGSRDEVVGCSIRNVTGWGVRVTGGSRDRIARCEIAATGLGGIALTGGDRSTLARADHEAVDNDIHGYARWKRTYEPAIALGGVGVRAEHNHIHDAPHEAISFEGNDHLIAGNLIERVCIETSDAGAIYGGRDWSMRGTVIRNNIVRDVRGFDGHGAIAVYLDDMLSGTRVLENTFSNVARGVFIGGGRDNAIEHNLFAGCDVPVHVDARGTGWAASSIDRDLVPRLRAVPYMNATWAARYPELQRLLAEAPAEPRGNALRGNLEWSCGPDEIDPVAASLLRSEKNVVAR